MTFGEIKAEVQKNIIRRQQEITELIPVWINRVQFEICRAYNFSFLKTINFIETTAGTSEYSLPDDFKDDISIWVESENAYLPLELITFDDALKLYPPNAPQGRPERFVMMDGKIYLYPTPDKTYSLMEYYYRYLPELVNDEDTNYITENFPDVLVKGAVYEGMVWLQEGDMTIWLQRYQSALRDMIAYDQKRRIPSKFFLKYSLGGKRKPIEWKG